MDAPWESPVRRRLRESQPVFGCTITTSSLDMAARAATAGFHFLWLEMEHSPIYARDGPQHRARHARSAGRAVRARAGGRDVDGQARARRRRARRRLSRSSARRPWREQAAAGVPLSAAGRRGSGASLATASLARSRQLLRLGRSQHPRRRHRRGSVRRSTHVEEIAATPGVDVVFVGTGDLSFSLGLRGQQQPPAASRRRRQLSWPPRGGTARLPGVRRARPRRRSATSSRASCSSRRRPISRCSKRARSSSSARTASSRRGASAHSTDAMTTHCTRPAGRSAPTTSGGSSACSG